MLETRELLRVKFHIIDVEVHDVYDYVAHFETFAECGKFIDENETVGNIITVIGTKIVLSEDIDLNSCCDYEF